ncbi:hypothetical protein GOP47_0008517 [Adiantum capillus-veneris]|uniref:Uncharacterized protein n=1 Tax=Adiantum capillus-veneris TaxID=13818 RepID=A0A9D4UZZ7_ADICA|nr:hypothetical protein GOP47_0008517 [Adiantum capillus-veneris]
MPIWTYDDVLMLVPPLPDAKDWTRAFTFIVKGLAMMERRGKGLQKLSSFDCDFYHSVIFSTMVREA